MTTLQQRLTDATVKAEDASAILDAVVNGPAAGAGSLVTTDSGDVKTVARAVAEVGDTSLQALQDLSNVDAAAVHTAAGDATVTAKGVIQLASQIEAESGTNDAKSMTPLRTAQAVAAVALTPAGGKNLTGGFTTDVEDLGDSGTGTVTPDLATESLKTLTINGSFTLAPPSSGNGQCVILTTNVTGGNGVTISGPGLFTHIIGVYDNSINAVHTFKISKIDTTSIIEITRIS